MKRKQPQILEHEGKAAFVVLPIGDYKAMRDRLDDLEDLALLRQAELADQGKPGRPLDEVLKELGLGGK